MFLIENGCLKNVVLDDTVTTFYVPDEKLENQAKYISSLYNFSK